MRGVPAALRRIPPVQLELLAQPSGRTVRKGDGTMPKKHTPRWGYQSRPWKVEREPIFTPEVLQRLCDDFAIPDTKQEEVRAHLEGSADTFYHWRNNVDDAPRPGERRAALAEIAHLAEQLKDRLDRIDDLSHSAFWFPERNLTMSVFTGQTETEWGHKIERVRVSDDSEAFWYETPDVLLRSLTIIQNYAKQGMERIPDDPGGQRRLEGLRYWIANLHILWTDILGRKFTVDSHEGQPVSEAARFCVAATKLTAPDISNTLIFTAMQARRRRKRPPT